MTTGNIQLADHNDVSPVVWSGPAYANPPPSTPRTSIVGMILERWPTALLVALLTWALGLTAIWYLVRPKFEVSATLHIAPAVKAILFADPQNDVSSNYREYVGTVAIELASAATIEAAVNTPEVRALPLLLQFEDPVRDIQRALSVDWVKNTELLRVAMIGEQPTEMVVIVKSILNAYLRDREQREQERDNRVMSTLKAERTNLEQRIRLKQEQLLQSKDTNDPEDAGKLLDKFISEVQQNLVVAKKNADIARAKISALETEPTEGDASVGDPAEFEKYSANDPDLRNLREQLRVVQMAAVSDVSKGLGSSHPDVKIRPMQIAQLKEVISDRFKELRRAFVETRRRELQAEVRNTDITVQSYQKQLEDMYQERNKISTQRIKIDDIRQERDGYEASLRQVKEKLWTVEVEQQRSARVTLASAPSAPRTPNVDKRMKIAAIVVMMGVGLGCGVAMLRSRMDTSLRCPVDVSERLGVRVLGSVEYLPEQSFGQEEIDRRMAEPIRGISTALLASSALAPSRRRLVTSPTAGSGKSSLAMKLARSLAATGRSVLLVDADNQGQGVTRRLKLVQNLGLMEFLEGKVQASEVCVSAGIPGVMVVPSGRCDDRFGDLLAGRGARERLDQMFAAYDEIIVDSPPVLVKSDPMVLATLVDEIVLVLRAGASTMSDAQAAREALSSVGGKVVGVIMNAVDARRVRYSYGYGYRYGSQYQYTSSENGNGATHS